MATHSKQPKPRIEQPLHAAQIHDALLNLRTVQARSGLGKTTLYKLIAAGH
jgi:predicted DNA-binding transcriptional regulator AlpA